jgi:hypothetical protein
VSGALPEAALRVYLAVWLVLRALLPWMLATALVTRVVLILARVR